MKQTYQEKAVAVLAHTYNGDEKTNYQYNNTNWRNNNQADALLDLLDASYADDTAIWWPVLAAYRNSGGTLERFQQWSRTANYDEPAQVARGWQNCNLDAGIGTLVHYAKLSGHTNKITELLSQHESRFTPQPIFRKQPIQKPLIHTEKARELLIQPWAGIDAIALEGELYERSQIHFDWEPGAADMLAVLELYELDEKLAMPGSRFDVEPPKTVSEWREILEQGGTLSEFIIPNPHCGSMKITKDGKPSWRADSCYIRRFAIIEFDEMPIADQLRLWLSLIDNGIRPAALIFSGSKSIHAWLLAKTEAEVNKIFECLTPMGADPATKNAGRLSRAAGATRADKNGTCQKLLFLQVNK